MNKGILCGQCNGRFSPLDDLLARQLSFLNGVIGVRRDRDDEPRPANVESAEGPLTLDHSGKPAFAGPRVLADEPIEDGRRKVSMEFASERQLQEWLAAQRTAGLQVQRLARGEGQRFLADPIPVNWSFGGSEAFREIGRIALNFLAHRWPDEARTPGLRPFKDWVEGTRAVNAGDPRFVWYAPADAFLLPSAVFNFGHQVLLSLDEQGTYGRVRFFSAFDLFVWFGTLPGVVSEAVVFNIDPLAEHPPADVKETSLDRASVPTSITPPTSETMNLEGLIVTRFRDLLKRVEDHQWSNATRGLLDALNATRGRPHHEQALQVRELLEPHRGHVLALARHVAEEIRRRATDDVTRILADAFESMLAHDAASPDGLSQIARASLGLGLAALVDKCRTNKGPLCFGVQHVLDPSNIPFSASTPALSRSIRSRPVSSRPRA